MKECIVQLAAWRSAGLSYCNYCGAQLSAAEDESVGTGGSKTGIACNGDDNALHLRPGSHHGDGHDESDNAITGRVPFLLLLVLEGVFMQLLLRGKRRDDSVDAVQLTALATRELYATQARALPEPKVGVTEHTTRAFDLAYTERRSKDTS